MQNKEMFAGLRVVELASVLAGPSVGQFFAELGAEVIKIENVKTEGDITRTWRSNGENTDDRSAYFCAVNWGKKSVALNLAVREGREIVHQLVRKTDLVITSYKPGDAERLGVDYETLRLINERIIYGKITGYGSHNERVGYDAVIQAEAGFMDLNGEPDGVPTKMPVALIDILAAHHLKEGLLLALLQRERTGRGEVVEVSLIQAAVASLANQATNWLVAGKLPARQGSAHPNIAPYGDIFTTADGREILLAVGSDRQFQDLCMVLQAQELSTHPSFQLNSERVANRVELHARLKVLFGKYRSEEILPKIHQAKIPVGLIQNLQQVFAMPEARQLLMAADDLQGVRSIVFNLSTQSSSLRLMPPPHLGEHTNEVLQNLGYRVDRIQVLREENTII